MVREANVKQATAEKQLKEAQGKVSPTTVVGSGRGGAGAGHHHLQGAAAALGGSSTVRDCRSHE